MKSEDITKSQQVEAVLQQAHDELEIKVEERTAELRKANEQLRSEIVERKRAEEALHASEAALRAKVVRSRRRSTDESGP